MFDFRKLSAYQEAKQFYCEMLDVVNNHQLDKTIKDQLSRAAFSIPLNLAEGSGRFSRGDRRHFFVIARSSLFECVAILDILHDNKIISSQQFERYHSNADMLSRIIFGMIRKHTT